MSTSSKKKSAKKSRPKKKKYNFKGTEFDKYDLYLRSVQSPETDVEFLRDTYKELRGVQPTTLREDFCGTFAICCEWVKLNSKFRAIGIDLDLEPISYGKSHHLAKLKPEQQQRIDIHNENVLSRNLPKADVIAALNFSYYIFKERELMKSYFRNCLERLNSEGLLIVDCFGGSACMEANEEETEFEGEGFSYFWDQDTFDPVNNHALFYIHFKRQGEKKRERAFTYDWRMWSIPELREIMREAGFKKTHVYWEGTTKDGDGDGEFERVEKGEACESWIAYIAGEA